MLIRKAALLGLSFLLTSCGTLSNPKPLPPSVCVEAEPEPVLSDDAGLVAAVTDEEKAAMRAALSWVAEVLDWGRLGWSVAETARKAC